MTFDMPTLVVATALVLVVCTIARFLLYRLLPQTPGLGHWTVASAMGAVTFFLFSTAPKLPPLLGLSLPQLLAFLAFMVAWDGFRRFLGRPSLSWSLQVTFCLCALVPLLIAHIENSMAFRAITSATVTLAVSSMVARELLSYDAPNCATVRATGWLYLINCFYFVVRMGVVTLTPEPITILKSNGFEAFTMLWWGCFTVVTTLFMALMASEQLRNILHNQANHDPLTGALNRRAFALLADKEIAQARRGEQPLTVLMMDLDHFKQINDRLGHAGGDSLLCQFVNAAQTLLRTEDIFCRFGGEEFLALLPNSNAQQAWGIAERLRKAYTQQATTQGAADLPLPFPYTVSIGISELLPDETLEMAIQRADQALYRAKATGRDRSYLADPPAAGNLAPI